MKPIFRVSPRRCKIAATMALLACSFAPARAVTPDEMLRDSAMEARARNLSQELRCVVCQNQSIDDSNAPLAHDLRVLLRERLTAGDSDKQTVDYIVARYGNFVLLKPPVQSNTILLWSGPVLFLVFAMLGSARYLRNRANAPPFDNLPLSANEQVNLDTLLSEMESK